MKRKLLSIKSAAFLLPVLILLFLLANLTKPILADWSVWSTPSVYYDFEGAKAQTSIKDRAGSNDLALTATSGTPTGIKTGGGVKLDARRNLTVLPITATPPTPPPSPKPAVSPSKLG